MERGGGGRGPCAGVVPAAEFAAKARAGRAAEPIEEKESYRWLMAMRGVRAEVTRCPGTRLVHVADSESDIYDVLAEGRKDPRTADRIIRSCQDREPVDDREDRAVADNLREELRAAPVLERRTITVRGRTVEVACEVRGRRAAAATVAGGDRRGPGRHGHPPRPGEGGRATPRGDGQRRARHRGGSARG